MTSSQPPRRRSGRRPGPSTTRAEILEAARAHFASEGYAATTLWSIAEDAGVDKALISRLFGSKEGLFAAALSISPDAVNHITEAFAGSTAEIGERVSRSFLELWDSDDVRAEQLLAMLRSAVTNEQAAAQLRSFVEVRLADVLGPQLEDFEDGAMRVGIAASMLLGIVTTRRLVRIPSLAALDREALIDAVAPAIQCVLASGYLSAAPAPPRKGSWLE